MVLLPPQHPDSGAAEAVVAALDGLVVRAVPTCRRTATPTSRTATQRGARTVTPGRWRSWTPPDAAAARARHLPRDAGDGGRCRRPARAARARPGGPREPQPGRRRLRRGGGGGARGTASTASWASGSPCAATTTRGSSSTPASSRWRGRPTRRSRRWSGRRPLRGRRPVAPRDGRRRRAVPGLVSAAARCRRRRTAPVGRVRPRLDCAGRSPGPAVRAAPTRGGRMSGTTGHPAVRPRRASLHRSRPRARGGLRRGDGRARTGPGLDAARLLRADHRAVDGRHAGRRHPGRPSRRAVRCWSSWPWSPSACRCSPAARRARGLRRALGRLPGRLPRRGVRRGGAVGAHARRGLVHGTPGRGAGGEPRRWRGGALRLRRPRHGVNLRVPIDEATTLLWVFVPGTWSRSSSPRSSCGPCTPATRGCSGGRHGGSRPPLSEPRPRCRPESSTSRLPPTRSGRCSRPTARPADRAADVRVGGSAAPSCARRRPGSTPSPSWPADRAGRLERMWLPGRLASHADPVRRGARAALGATASSGPRTPPTPT